MLFNSPVFLLAFLPFALIVYYSCRSVGYGKHALIAVSLLFYGYWDPRLLPLLLCSILVTWLIVGASFRFPRRGIWVTAGICANLLLLAVFKYANFLSGLTSDLGLAPRRHWDIVLPLAISFFTFHQISYLVDIQRGERRFYSLSDYVLYVVFFPHLIAGPIVRHNEFIPQIDNVSRRAVDMASIGTGTVLFVLGLIKKTGLADPLAGIADPLFEQARHAALAAPDAVAATLSFTLQIYFDFSGYTDMAIGLSLMLGYVLPQNFNSPYGAASLIDFWRRWHMTLSRFLRDYLYFPLGGNRHGLARQHLALLVTMVLGGLWHGANWTFVAWGALHGVALAVNHQWRRWGIGMPGVLGWALTFCFVAVCFALFRSDGIGHARNVILPLGGLIHGSWQAGNREAMLALAAALAILGPTSLHLTTMQAVRHRVSAAVLGIGFLAALLWTLTLERYAPFIYFQF